MCIGIPARITDIVPGFLPIATVDVAGQIRQCSLAYVPDATLGDYVLIQNGYAMDVLSEADARQSLEVIAEHNIISEGLSRPGQ
ncbi:HypC/HybG/HupF family hydrogenase formation chaperone [Corynebacterium epidermidicanis]|uniref:Hydrogenase assembly chaperone HypC/HupF n=1 Tax=Corynebacterium epidermidicanis TaxID=1050174 RepID=A0A0G3GMY9_9CORY|nr:HypC/HybG/HupF family hydrogenase formation chaperone [Corynebacterium epidermidicanis]AKK02514.1 hydrogenase assembly chaperone HypC/HupF [Corynebacterium epidermidicanis]